MAAGHRRLGTLIVGAVLFFGWQSVAHAQSFSFELLTGSAENLPTPLTVHQTGYPDIHLVAQYDTKPFGIGTPYYAWRADFWNKAGDQAWELRQVHHRLFLTNNPPEIQFFAIHFGYNFFMAGRAWKHAGFVYHADAGVLICAPQNTVREMTLMAHKTGIFDSAYVVSGIGAEFAVSRAFTIAPHVFAVANLGFMAGHGNVPVALGSAEVPNLSAHGQVGLGINF